MKNQLLHIQTAGLAFVVCASMVLSEPNLRAQPSITNQPASITTNLGVNVTFKVGASGSSPLSYRWWFSGTNIPVGTSATLILGNVKPNQAGDYFVIVTNAAGSATSSIATLTLIPATVTAPTITSQPGDVTTNVGAAACFSVSATGSPLNYRWWFSGTNGPVGTSATLALRNVKTNQAGNYFVTVTNAAGSATSSVATLTLYSVTATKSPGLWLITHSPTDGDILKLVLDLGKNYRIQSSPNMLNWSDVTNFFSDTSPMYFTNGAGADERLFYRLVSP